MAINSAHSLAFHRGLGSSTASASSTPFTKYIDPASIEYFSKIAYAKSNFAIVANGAKQEDLSKWVNEFFENVPAAPLDSVATTPSKYHGGEERIAHDSGNAIVIGFPGSSSFTGNSYKPEIAVLASLLGGQSSIKWSSGFSILGNAKGTSSTKVQTTSAIYSDAGLLYTTISGPAEGVKSTAQAAVEAIQKIAAGEITAEQITKAKAAAKFKELEYGQDLKAGLVLTGNGLVHNTKAYQIDEVAKAVDSVSDEAIKSVSLHSLQVYQIYFLTNLNRLPSHYSRPGPPFLPSVISMFCRSLTSLVLRCKYGIFEDWLLSKNSSFGGACVPLPVISPR